MKIENHDNLSLLLLKPDLFSRNLEKILATEIAKNLDLELIYEKEIILKEKSIIEYQPVIKERDYIYGESWKEKLLACQLSGPSMLLIFKGNKPIEKTTIFKKFFRNKYLLCSTDPDQKVAQNLVHSADDMNDLYINLKALIPEKKEFIKEIEKNI